MKYGILSFVLLAGISIDQTIKYIASVSPKSIAVLGDFLYFDYTENPNLLIGVHFNYVIFVVLFALVLLSIAILKNKRRGLYAPLTIAVGGAISNLIDRVRFGFTVDYLTIPTFAHFNIADIAILIGCAWVVTDILIQSRLVTKE